MTAKTFAIPHRSFFENCGATAAAMKLQEHFVWEWCRAVLPVITLASLLGGAEAGSPATANRGGPGGVNLAALRRAAEDLATTWPEECGGRRGASWKEALDRVEAQWNMRGRNPGAAEAELEALAGEAKALQRRILMANPLLGDFDAILVVRRKADAPRLGLPANWESNCILPRAGFGNDIARIETVSPDSRIETVYRPPDDAFVGDLELHWDGDRVMFSKSDPQRPWQVYEIGLEGADVRQITPDMGADVDNYDGCYLPDGDVSFTSTATMVAVPCVNGGANVANLYRVSADGRTVRQLCFDQEHNWCPTVMEDGRLLYLRWEYTDLPHSNSRRLFTMNPDGTAQMACYGTSSYWPNSVFFARPIPGRPTQMIGIVTGHHGVPRMGELVLFDTRLGRSEAEGAVQRIPGFGRRVERVVKDALADASWPKFLHPHPLGRPDGTGSGKYFLVAAWPARDAAWGIYLVDVFDNMLLLREEPGCALFEPVPVQRRPRPPVVPDRTQPGRRDALVFLADIYAGPGLDGIPRGEVKALRVFTYIYGYRGMGGLYGTIGMDGPWDARRVLGTVPVEQDGSAFFRIPANTPVSVQPLDDEGKALQLMRSWFTGMPGETLACVGCHEPQNSSPPGRRAVALRKPPAEIAPWRAPARGFAFAREVQPLLDARCVRCHDGARDAPQKSALDLRGDVPMPPWNSKLPGMQNREWGGKFTAGYASLHRFVRHPGIESDLGVLVPMDFHADTTELVQMLRKGHQGVTLTDEEWDRLVTWIDLNAPFHGDWGSIAPERAEACESRRAELRRRYANVDEYHLDPPPPPRAPAADPGESAGIGSGEDLASPTVSPDRAGAEVKTPLPPRRPPFADGGVLAPHRVVTRRLDLGEGVEMTFAHVPAGEFFMGTEEGAPDERPSHRVAVSEPFWMAVTETSNEQYGRFDPRHDSRREDVQGYQFGMEGYPMGEPGQPVVRVSWRQAMAFCAWLSARTGLDVALPTEAQWEYACRGGAGTPFSFGDLGTDFSKHANLADVTTRELATDTYLHDTWVPLSEPTEADDWLPKDTRFNDGALVSAVVGRYQANPWGFHDLHGNVAEWTRSEYRPYPYLENDGRNRSDGDARSVARGGSWRDRPCRATATYRYAYRPYQRVFNVGFRVVFRQPVPAVASEAGSSRSVAKRQGATGAQGTHNLMVVLP